MNSLYKKSSGSGGPYATGWVNTLFPYIEDYKGNLCKNKYAENWSSKGFGGGPTLEAYTNGLSKVPFKWEYYDEVYDMNFIGGFVGVSQDENSLALKPEIGWAIQDTNIVSKGPLDTNKDW